MIKVICNKIKNYYCRSYGKNRNKEYSCDKSSNIPEAANQINCISYGRMLRKEKKDNQAKASAVDQSIPLPVSIIVFFCAKIRTNLLCTLIFGGILQSF